jgi:uncharacterized protein (TIGR00369 family)
MMRHLGARLLKAEPGLRAVALPYSDRVTQQQGGFHGGAMGALADIAGGRRGPDRWRPRAWRSATVEYKVNFWPRSEGGGVRATVVAWCEAGRAAWW